MIKHNPFWHILFLLIVFTSSIFHARAQSDSTLNNNNHKTLESKLDILTEEVKELKNLIKLLSSNSISHSHTQGIETTVPPITTVDNSVDNLSNKTAQSLPQTDLDSKAIALEIRRQEANEQLWETGTELILGLIFKPKK